jgi:hypothetical protein
MLGIDATPSTVELARGARGVATAVDADETVVTRALALAAMRRVPVHIDATTVAAHERSRTVQLTGAIDANLPGAAYVTASAAVLAIGREGRADVAALLLSLETARMCLNLWFRVAARREYTREAERYRCW